MFYKEKIKIKKLLTFISLKLIGILMKQVICTMKISILKKIKSNLQPINKRDQIKLVKSQESHLKSQIY